MKIKILLLITVMVLFTVNKAIAQVEPYLSSPTSTSIWVSWKTIEETESKVEYGLTAGNLDMIANGSYESLSGTYKWHTVKLSNLTLATRYYYRTVSGTQVSEIHRFKTQAAEGTNTGHYRFAIIGDHQVMADDRYESLVLACKDKVIKKYASSPSDTLIEDHLNLMVCDGDMVDQGTLSQYEELHFGQSRPLMSNIPIMTVPGNHEYYNDPNLINYFGHYVYDDISYQGITGIHGEEYYAFQVANILFVMINSNRWADPDQFIWIEDIVATADTDPSVEWVFAINHHCFYNEQMPSDGISSVRDGYGPRLAETDKYVMHITGHAHLYARGSIRNHPCHVIINGGASWDQYWGQDTDLDYQDVQKTFERQIFQIVDVDLDNREMLVETYSNGTNLTPGFTEDLLIDEYYMKLDAPSPDKPAVANSIPDSLMLPFTFEGSTYSGQEPFNSIEYQLADNTMNFDDPVLSFKTDYENIFLSSGSPDYIPIDQNEGIDITQFTIDSTDVFSGLKFLRFRYRDQSLHWSDWSDTVSFNVLNGKLRPPKCPVLRYKLAGDANEFLGSGLNGTPNAGVTFVTDPDLGEVADFNNYGMITISSGSTANLDLPTEAISVSCWVKLNSTDTWGGFVGLIQDNGSYEKGWILGTRYDKFSFALSAGGSLNYLTVNSTLNLGEWYHVAGTFDGTNQKIYVNGELQASAENAGEIAYPSTGWFQIGAYKDDDENFGHDGRISDVIIWESAISQEDAMNLYNNTMPPCVDFEADMTEINIGGEVQFTDLSQFDPQSWLWDFEGGDPETSEDQNPLVTYNQMGDFNVKLMAGNIYGNNTLIKEMYIKVGPVGIEDVDGSFEPINIYPNPANNKINIEINDSEFVGSRLIVLNSNGSKVYSQNLSSTSTLESIDIGDFPKGIYFIKLINEDDKVVIKSFAVE